jgi:hypothetical protein
MTENTSFKDLHFISEKLLTKRLKLGTKAVLFLKVRSHGSSMAHNTIIFDLEILKNTFLGRASAGRPNKRGVCRPSMLSRFKLGTYL